MKKRPISKNNTEENNKEDEDVKQEKEEVLEGLVKKEKNRDGGQCWKSYVKDTFVLEDKHSRKYIVKT